MAATAAAVAGQLPISFKPQSGPQEALIACPVEDIFFGGARGGGKTFGMLLDFLDHALTYGRYATGVFFRKVYKNLEEVIAEAHRIFPHFGGKWEEKSQSYVFRSGAAAGARLKFRHLARDEDADAYQGHAYTWVCFEELTQWATSGPADKLFATLRSAHGVPTMFRATGNPGGAGHNWVKHRYISPWRRGFKVLRDAETGHRRMFIPSKLEDNQILMQNDPLYEAKLKRVGTAALVKAWRHGDWDIVAGGFFDDIWNADKIMIDPFDLPASWTRRRSFDWGSSKPGSLGLWAISDGQQPTARPGQELPYFPRGSFIRFGEWYIAKKDSEGFTVPNVGLRMQNDAMGEEIARLTRNTNWNGDVADPAIFTAGGGESVFDQLQKGAKRQSHILNFGPADNSRIAGWQKMRTMIQAAATDSLEVEGLWAFETCLDFARTIPVLQSDKLKPDDVDSDGEDHIGDETRYALMSTGSITGADFGTAPVQGR